MFRTQREAAYRLAATVLAQTKDRRSLQSAVCFPSESTFRGENLCVAVAVNEFASIPGAATVSKITDNRPELKKQSVFGVLSVFG
jgi:hypothetical protein